MNIQTLATGRHGSIAIFLVFSIFYAVFVARTFVEIDGSTVGTLFDDALISLRYAHNLYSGYGLVWNPGENPPVEGYTNLLWTLIMASTFLIASQATAPIVVAAFGATTLIASGWFARRIVLRLSGDATAAAVAAVLVMSSFPLVFWTLRGMEVGLVALLSIIALDIGLRKRDTAGMGDALGVSALASMAFLIRPDALIIFLPVLTFVIINLANIRRATPGLLLLASVIAAAQVFRIYYFGEAYPNTYFLKMTGVDFFERVQHGLDAALSAGPPYAIVIAASLAALPSAISGRNSRDVAVIALGAAGLQVLYVVYIGGDAWRFYNSNRFFATVEPLLLIAAVVGCAAAPSVIACRPKSFIVCVSAFLAVSALLLLVDHENYVRKSNVFLLVGGAILFGWPIAAGWLKPARKRVGASPVVLGGFALALIVAAPGLSRWAIYNAEHANDDKAFARLGVMLKQELPPDATLALGWLGAPSYFSELHTIDILGKTDKRIARTPPSLEFRPGHNKQDLDYSIGTLNPDVILIDAAAAKRFGYLVLPNGLAVRPQFIPQIADIERLGRSWCRDVDSSSYCPKWLP